VREPEIRETLCQYQQTADELLAAADKAVVERVARMLALYVGYYQLRHGPIPPTALAPADEVVSSAEQLADRVEAMRVLAAALTIASAAALDAD
jgi:hypothetical protein